MENLGARIFSTPNVIALGSYHGTLTWGDFDNNSPDLAVGKLFSSIDVFLNDFGPLSFDCNTNTISDECDIAGATSRDCNVNGIPDECDACTVELCADADCDGIRDDNCLWVDCGAQGCSQTAVAFADVGGAFGDCLPDGFCNIHDRDHVMACFAGLNTCACPGACSPP